MFGHLAPTGNAHTAQDYVVDVYIVFKFKVVTIYLSMRYRRNAKL